MLEWKFVTNYAVCLFVSHNVSILVGVVIFVGNAFAALCETFSAEKLGCTFCASAGFRSLGDDCTYIFQQFCDRWVPLYQKKKHQVKFFLFPPFQIKQAD